jgi:uncharacterized protein (TIGR02391 family)
MTAIQREADSLPVARRVSQRDADILFEELVSNLEIRQTTGQLFHDGYYALAVEEAFKCVNNRVKAKTRQGTDGAALMRSAFSPNGPLLRLNPLVTQSQRDQQHGYMEMFAGAMIGIRNPRAHEHQYLDAPDVALEMICLANHLMRIVETSTKATKRGKRRAAND